MLHYIARGGEHGCMPDNCQAYETISDAIDGLDRIYELYQWQRIELGKLEKMRDIDGTCVALRRKQGGAYCEISVCDCDSPWEHAEFDSPENWPEYAQEPEEGDYIIESRVRGKDIIYKKDGKWRYEIQENDDIYTIISEEMEREKYWPDVWTLSDHGNLEMITLDSLKQEEGRK